MKRFDQHDEIQLEEKRTKEMNRVYRRRFHVDTGQADIPSTAKPTQTTIANSTRYRHRFKNTDFSKWGKEKQHFSNPEVGEAKDEVIIL
jgi:hypothetical protein